MKKETADSIIASYPGLYSKDFVFNIGDGWETLVRDFSKNFDRLVKKAKKFKKIDKVAGPPRIERIERVLAGLRIHTSGLSTNKKIQGEIQILIQKTEEKSYFACEECGEVGKIRASYQVFCDKHVPEVLTQV